MGLNNPLNPQPGGRVKARTLLVSGTATGVLANVLKYLPQGSTWSKSSGLAGVTIASNGDASVTAAIGVGVSVTGVVAGTYTDAANKVQTASYTLTLTGAAAAPAAPSVTLTPGDGQVTIAWTNGATGGAAITSNRIYVLTSAGVTVADYLATDSDGSPYVLAWPNGDDVFVKVSAVNAAGLESPLSAEQSATPAAATGATATFAMAQLAGDGERFFPRTVPLGGGLGRGFRDIPITLASVSGGGTVYARVRRASDGVIVQAPFALSNIMVGSTTVSVRVDAREEAVFIDLQGSGGWQDGTRAINVGGVTTLQGQSNIAAFCAVRQADSTTLASLNISPNPNGLCYIYSTAGAGDSIVGSASGGLATASWHIPDVNNTSGFCNSAGIATYLNGMIAREGVAWAVVGEAIGGTTQRYHSEQWSTGLTLRNIFINAGLSKPGALVEERIKYIGGTDMTGGCSKKTFKQWHRRLTNLMDSVTTSAPGCITHLLTHGVDTSAATGNRRTRRDVRQAGEEIAAENPNTIYYQPWDYRLIDKIHQYTESSQRQAYNFLRQGLWKGPTIKTVSLSDVTLTITVEHNTGGTALVGTGNWWKWFAVISKAPAAGRSMSSQFTVTNGTIVDATTFTLTLSTPPGNGHDIEVHPYLNEKDTDNGFNSGLVVTSHLRDNYTGDSYGFGRHLYPTPMGFFVPASVSGGTINAPPTGYVTNPSPFDLPMTSPTYEASHGSFGQRLNGGRGTMGSGKSVPFDDFTTMFFFKTPAVAQGATAGLVAYNSTGTWIGLNASKQIQIMGFGTSTFACSDDKLYFFRHSGKTVGGQRGHLYNVTDGIDHGIVLTSATPWAGSNGTMNIRAINGANSPFTGSIDDVRMYDSCVWWEGDSPLPPAGPLAPADIPEGLFAYWPLDGSGADIAGVF